MPAMSALALGLAQAQWPAVLFSLQLDLRCRAACIQPREQRQFLLFVGSGVAWELRRCYVAGLHLRIAWQPTSCVLCRHYFLMIRHLSPLIALSFAIFLSSAVLLSLPTAPLRPRYAVDTSFHIIPYHIISYILSYIISNHIISCHIIDRQYPYQYPYQYQYPHH